MKKLILPLLVITSGAAIAQLSVQPQVGMETSKTTIRSNEFATFSPAGIQIAPRIGVRMDYKLKTGHGAFLGIATATPSAKFSFTEPATAATSFTTSTKGLQLRLEGGYQFTTKKIALSKPAAVTMPENKFASQGHRGKHGGEGHTKYGSWGKTKFSGGMHHRHQSLAQAYAKAAKLAKENVMYMRIKPFAGIAFAPFANNAIATETRAGQTSYEYNTGMNTAVIAGTAFEFGDHNQPKFIVSVNYMKGVGNNTQTIIRGTTAKPVLSTLRSTTSGFNVTMGIPFNLKKQAVVTQVIEKKQCYRSAYEGRCGRYKM